MVTLLAFQARTLRYRAVVTSLELSVCLTKPLLHCFTNIYCVPAALGPEDIPTTRQTWPVPFDAAAVPSGRG